MPQFVNVILNILTSGFPCAILAIGVFLTFRLLDFADMTAEGSFLIGGSLCVAMIYLGLNPWLATLIGLLGGAICGFITGVLHTKLGIPKLLSGIITMTATASIALAILGIGNKNGFFGNNITLSTDAITIYSMFYSKDASLAMYNSVIRAGIMAAIVVVVFLLVYYFFGTEYGFAIRATGMNEKMARAQGINSTRCIISCTTLSNALIGLAGALFVQEQRSCDAKTATGFLVIGLASILIGEAIFGRRSFKNWLISVSLGAIVYFTIVTLAIEAGFPTELKYLLYAVLITLALCIPLFKKGIIKLINKIKTSKVKKAEAE